MKTTFNKVQKQRWSGTQPSKKHNIPHREAQSTSELKRFLYFRISGASVSTMTGAGATLTFTRELRRTSVDASDWLSSVRLVDREAWLAAKPNMRKDRSEPRCWGGGGGVSILFTALQYYNSNMSSTPAYYHVHCAFTIHVLNNNNTVSWVKPLQTRVSS